MIVLCRGNHSLVSKEWFPLHPLQESCTDYFFWGKNSRMSAVIEEAEKHRQ